jgi:hypothetical protein
MSSRAWSGSAARSSASTAPATGKTRITTFLRTGHVQVSLADLDDIERQTVTGYRWWSQEELASTAEVFYPSELPGLLQQLAPGDSEQGGLHTSPR